MHTLLELAEQRMHVAAVDRQPSAERRLTHRAAFDQGAQDDVMLSAEAFGGECVSHQSRADGCHLANEPTGQSRDALGWVVFGVVVGVLHAQLRPSAQRTLAIPTLTRPTIWHIVGITNVGHTNE
jgi:hypothetical protein